MIGIKRIYDPLSRDDGRRVLVDRIWPRGIKKGQAEIAEWLKELAPTTELRKWFAHDPAKWEEFRARYVEELAGREDLLEKLRREAKEGMLTLVYAARDTEHNNAVVLKELLEKSA
jgi:uncharacterized protein YeaO (DUF488 family)